MSGESSARPSSSSTNPLRRRMHLLERASRSFTTADSSTRNGDADELSEDLHSLPSPPTSYEEDDDEGEYGKHEGEGEGQSGEETIYGTGSRHREPAAAPHEEVEGEGEYDTPDARPWYKPSIPVLLALAPPIGNWLTGGDHLKDLLLLLLLVFYLHQLVEVPWRLYHAARPRRSPTPAVSAAPTLAASRAQAELRRLELALLLLCLLTPALGVGLLRSLASFATSSPSPSSSPASNSSSSAAAGGEPISWFSTTIFFLLTALRPLRELTSRLSTRTSTLHTYVHTLPSFPSPSSSTSPAAMDGQMAELQGKVARLEATVARLAQREDALYGYVEDALAPIEKGVRRVERRVGKLRSARKNGELALLTAGGAGTSGTKSNGTIFIPAPATKSRASPQSLIASWFGSPPPAPASSTAYVLPPPSPTLAGKRRALDPIPEEGEVGSTSHLGVGGNSHSPTARSTQTQGAGTGLQAHPHVLVLFGALIRQWLAAGLALALYPLYLVLLPVRGALGFLVGVV
ncbi:hypothetical protein DFH06DRAFT_1327737 [Mycena polygramma]|nr:hypothetical protein DFH06DRAFT_1327737 [Mycena polygramma]